MYSIDGGEKVEKVLLKVEERREGGGLDLVVIKVGMTPEPENLKRWNLELVEGGIKVDQQMTTSRRGVFACGMRSSTPENTGRS